MNSIIMKWNYELYQIILNKCQENISLKINSKFKEKIFYKIIVITLNLALSSKDGLALIEYLQVTEFQFQKYYCP